jgi:hypothetical protein
VSEVDAQIDELYKLPLGEFVAARNALAKTLSGTDAKRVKTLEKPTLVPWSVNQLYWHARPTYERLMKAGAALRSAQIAALKGRDADVRQATESHRETVAAAVREATALAAGHGARPATDQLARMLEALSLSPTPPKTAGRIVELMQPSGFEALAGITPTGARAEKPSESPSRSRMPRAATAPELRIVSTPKSARDERAQRAAATRAREEEQQRAKEAAAARRAGEASLKAATKAFAAAQAAEARAQQELDEATTRLERAQADVARARRELQAAEQHLARLPEP